MQHFPQDFPTTISHKNFLQQFPARFSRKDFQKLDPDLLVSHHPIPNAKFPPITAFLKLAFPLLHFPQDFLQEFPELDFPATISHKNFLQEFPARFSRKIFPQEFPARFSHKIFPQEFPARFSRNNFPQDFPARISRKILIGWLSITLFQMLNFHKSLPCYIGLLIIKSPRCPHHPFLKSYGNPKSMNKLTLTSHQKILCHYLHHSRRCKGCKLVVWRK